jgi:hypothetical protein
LNAKAVGYLGLKEDSNSMFLLARLRFRDFLPIIMVGDTCSNAKDALSR